VKALEYKQSKKDSAFLQIANREIETHSENECLIKVRGCGVCGSDLLKLERSLVKEGTVLGHEMVGEIYKISDQLSEKYNLKIGDRIISSHHVPCGICDYCLNKQESLCKQFKSTNFNPGAFCEYTILSEDHLKYTVRKISEHVSDLEASFTEPIACCIKAIKKSKLLEYRGKKQVTIFGLGSIGQIIGRLINHYRQKLNLDINIDGIDLIEAKREQALEHGFDQCLDKIEDSGESSNFIFLAAGAAPCVDSAINNISNGGTIVVFSSLAEEFKGFNNNAIYYKELNIMGSYSPNLEDLYEAHELIEKQEITCGDLISHKSNLSNLGETILKARSENGIKVYLDLT